MTKKKEDNRDVFDKALDYAPVAGGVIGGVVGVRAGKKLSSMKRAGDLQNIDRQHKAAYERWLAGLRDPDKGVYSRDYNTMRRLEEQEAKIRRAKPGIGSRVAGGVAGAYSGALAGATLRNNYESKRRK